MFEEEIKSLDILFIIKIVNMLSELVHEVGALYCSC